MSNRARKLAALAAVLLVYAMMDASARDAPLWDEVDGAVEDLDQIVVALFETHVFAFEALGVLLTAAMIGAMVIARPMHGKLDTDNYPAVSDEELEATQHISDVEGRA